MRAAVRGYPQGSPGGHGPGRLLPTTLALHGVPHVAVEVIVARKEQAATEREGHGGRDADDARGRRWSAPGRPAQSQTGGRRHRLSPCRLWPLHWGRTADTGGWGR